MEREHAGERTPAAAPRPAPTPARVPTRTPTVLLPAPVPLTTSVPTPPVQDLPGGLEVLRRYTPRPGPPAEAVDEHQIIRRGTKRKRQPDDDEDDDRMKVAKRQRLRAPVRSGATDPMVTLAPQAEATAAAPVTARQPFAMTGGSPTFASTDPTLTPAQQAEGGFKPHAHETGEDFRFRSNPTKAGISSGYHEAAVTTDNFVFFRDAVDQGDGTAQLPSSANTAPLQALQGLVVDKTVLDFLLAAADGFRTDTAMTIMSAPGGQAAGHSGSGVTQSGQGPAHDLVRQACSRILQDPASATVSRQAVTVAIGAYVVGSIAPGEIARLVPTQNLKAGPGAIATWEARRNQAKARVEGLFATLSDDEQAYVQRHSQAYLSSVDPTGGRHLGQTSKPGLKRATSLPRLETNHGAQVSGGKYDAARGNEAVPAPADFGSASDVGLYVTQTFRLDR